MDMRDSYIIAIHLFNDYLIIWQFEKSPPMVTYLACFIVCDFEHKSTFTKIYKTLFRVYATPTQSERVSYALDIGANITDYFEKYFDVRK